MLLSTVVVGALGLVVALGVFGLFSATTQNAGNEISTGTVALSDNDSGQAMFSINNAKPGDIWVRCIKVTYSGSVPADVHFYGKRTAGPLEPYLNMKVEQGTQAAPVFPGCNGFAPDAVGTLMDGPISQNPDTNGTYETGLPVNPAGQAVWNPGNTLVFRFTATLDASAPDSIQGQSTGVSGFFWEARNDQ
jgi:hypothetical protein